MFVSLQCVTCHCMPVTVHLWEEPVSMSSALLAGGSYQISSSLLQAEQTQSLHLATR